MRYIVLGIVLFITACANSAPAPVHMGTRAGYEYAPRGNYVRQIAPPPSSRNNSYTQQELAPPSQSPEEQSFAPPPSSTEKKQGFHTVGQGETLYGIARFYKTNVRNIVNANNLEAPYYLETGQQLVIPSQQISPSPARQQIFSQPFNPSLRDTNNQLVEKLPPLDAPPVRTSGRFIWPVEGRVVSAFGEQAGGQRNDGINIDVPEGTPVKAAESAVVAYAGNQIRGFGNLVLLKHSNGWITTYAHNRKILVKRGERVEKGQPIAESGATGNVKSPQVHFEVRQGKRALDPLKYLERNQITQL